jgi:hypothetical protein
LRPGIVLFQFHTRLSEICTRPDRNSLFAAAARGTRFPKPRAIN